MRRWMTSRDDEDLVFSSYRLVGRFLGWAGLVAIVACSDRSDRLAPDRRACSLWLPGLQSNATHDGPGSGVVYRTRDGGRTWAPKTRSIPPLCCSSGIESFQFSDPDRGWFGASMALYRTLDGGESWQRHLPLWDVPIEGIGDVFSEVTIDEIEFFDNQRGLVFVEGRLNRQTPGPSTGHVLMTTDGGATWRGEGSALLLGVAADPSRPGSGRVPTACTTPTGHALAKVQASVVPGDDFSFSVTSDYGQSWRPLPRLPTVDYSYNVYAYLETWCTGDDELWITDNGSILLRSRDAGRTWEDLRHRIPKLARYFTLQVAASRILIAEGWREDGFWTTLRTLDAGRTWREIYSSNPLDADRRRTRLVTGASDEGTVFVESDVVLELEEIHHGAILHPYSNNVRALVVPFDSEEPRRFPFPSGAWLSDRYPNPVTTFALMESVAPGGAGCDGG